MKKIKRKIKKKVLVVLVIFEVIIISGFPFYSAQALFGDYAGNVIRKFFEDDLNVNTELSVKGFTEQINTFDRKNEAPEVSVTFQGTVRDGEKITAIATVQGISNPEDAYYTWYIIPEDVEEVNAEAINEGKILAIKAMVKSHSNFNKLVYDQVFNGGNGNGEIDGPEWPDKIFKVANAFLGGDNNRLVKEAFMYMWGDGEMLELGEAKKVDYGECDEGFEPVCMMEDQSRRCPILDPPVEGAGEATASADGGDGGSADSGAGTADGGGGGDGDASASIEIKEEPTLDGGIPFSRCLRNGAPRCTSEGTVCPSGGTSYCVPKMQTSLGEFFFKLNDVCVDPDILWANWFEKREIAGAECKDFEGDFLTEFECEKDPDEEDDYEPYNDEDMHMFPFSGGGEMFGLGLELSSEVKLEFDMDPISVSTTDLGVPDIDLIRGKGVNELTWEYSTGDRVGVIVEGMSTIPTPHYDKDSDDEGGGYMPMFVFMSGGCDIDEDKKGGYSLEIKGKETLVKTAAMTIDDLNECLANNLVDPGASQYDALEVSLTSNWENQAATVGADEQLWINSQVISDSEEYIDSSQLHYQWNINCSEDDSDVCEEGIDITQELRNGESLFTKTKGVDLPSVGINLNVPSSVEGECLGDGGRGYMCATLQVNTRSSGDVTSYGSQSIIIPIQNSGGRLKAFSTDTDGNSISTREEICGGEDMDFSLCRIVRGEIIGVEMPMPDEGSGDLISWTINGKPYFCNSSISSECGDESNTNKIFFPVISSIGDTITVNASYSNPTEGDFANKTMSRSFLVVEPEVKIEAVSGGNYKTLGKYIDSKGEEFIKESWRTIEVTSGNSVALKASFTPSFIEKDSEVEWSFDGEKTFDNTLQIVPELPANVSLKARYDSSNNRNALINLFGIKQNINLQKDLSTSARLIEGNGGELSSKDKAIGFFATTASNTPAYFFFLLKMVLLVSGMLFISNLALSLAYSNRRY